MEISKLIKENEELKKEIEEQKQNWKELLHEYGLKCEELNNSISKDKIREKIKELEEMALKNNDIFGQMRNYAILTLKDLLEEN